MFGAIRLDPRFRLRAIFETVNGCRRFTVARQHFDKEAATYAVLANLIRDASGRLLASQASITAMMSLTSQRRVVTPASHKLP
jgi:hypothetical protein